MKAIVAILLLLTAVSGCVAETRMGARYSPSIGPTAGIDITLR